MNIEYTDRGFVLIRFADAAGVECSLQESSIADDERIWLGPKGKPDEISRMHLDKSRTLMLMAIMKSVAEGRETMPMVTFMDTNGQRCVASNDHAGNVRIVAGDKPVIQPMVLDAPLALELLGHLEVFIQNGVLVAPDRPAGASAPRHLSIKIPASSLDDTDVGGTGVALQDLIDAFVDLASGDASPARKAEIGSIAQAMIALRK